MTNVNVTGKGIQHGPDPVDEPVEPTRARRGTLALALALAGAVVAVALIAATSVRAADAGAMTAVEPCAEPAGEFVWGISDGPDGIDPASMTVEIIDNATPRDPGVGVATPRFSRPRPSPDEVYCYDRCALLTPPVDGRGMQGVLAYAEASRDADGTLHCRCTYVGMRVLRNLW